MDKPCVCVIVSAHPTGKSIASMRGEKYVLRVWVSSGADDKKSVCEIFTSVVSKLQNVSGSCFGKLYLIAIGSGAFVCCHEVVEKAHARPCGRSHIR